MKNIENLAQILDGLTARLQKCRKPTPRRNLLRSAVTRRRLVKYDIIGLVEVPTSSCYGCICQHQDVCNASDDMNKKCFEDVPGGKFFQYRKI